jgi:hypothetical protein
VTEAAVALRCTDRIDFDLPKGNPAKPAGYTREMTMNLHAPSMWIFVISVLIAVLAVVSTFTPIQYVSTYAFWVGIIAFIVLAFGNLVRT